MIVLASGDLVLPDRILGGASLILDGDRIAAVDTRPRVEPAGAVVVDVSDQYVLPGFVDVHVHGVAGRDTLDGGDAVAAIAAMLPRYGVTAFCPTTVACPPDELRAMLAGVRDARVSPRAGSARVLPAHLESNFINPEYRGAQPLESLCTAEGAAPGGAFTAADILDVLTEHRADVGIITMAPEMPGGRDLMARFIAAGHHVSIGHSGATYEEADAAIDAGVRRATHLFNRMSPMSHRDPGVAGAVLAREEVCVELICDAAHVHPAVCRVAIAAKGTSSVVAITDGTAASAMPRGTQVRLGGRTLVAGEEFAELEDGTVGGSILTMDGAFRTIIGRFGCSIVDATQMCSTTPARERGLTGFGVLARGAAADLVLLDRGFGVTRTFIGGREVYRREP